ncbi:MAG: mechanosensitive ion channel [Pseudomonadota bacterium]|nr:mechanosensitive ion channel [Pseudomonadota bacterium]
MSIFRMKSGLLQKALSACLLILLFISYPASSASPGIADAKEAISQISISVLERKIEGVEADASLSVDEKSSLASLYRKTINNLELSSANQHKADAFILSKQDAPVKAAQLRKKTIEKKKLDAEDSLEVTSNTPIEVLEQLLLKEKADLAAVEANLQKTREAIKYQAGRPQAIREQLIEAKKLPVGLSGETEQPLAGSKKQSLIEAEGWLRKSQATMQASQIRMLDQELLSQATRLDLLVAEEEKAEHSVAFVRIRAKRLEQLVDVHRQYQARLTESRAETARVLAEGKHRLVKKLAGKNAGLSAQISDLTSRLKEVEQENSKISAEAQRLSDEFDRTRKKLSVAGLSQILGQILLEQRRVLPDTRNYSKKVRQIEGQIATVSLEQIQHNDELKALRDIDQYIADYTAGITDEEKLQIDDELQYLAADRKQFLQQAYKTGNTFLRTLSELDIAQRSLNEVAEQYGDFLSEHLLWIRSTSPISLSSFSILPAQWQELLAPTHWRDMLSTLYRQATSKPWMLFTLVIFFILRWKDKALRKALISTGDHVGDVMRDKISYTAWGVALTVLLALSWPMLIGSIGWQLLTALDSSVVSKNVGSALIFTAQALFFLRVYYVLCAQGGIADRHFKWPQASLSLLRRDINIFIFTFLPPGFIAFVVIYSDIPGHDEGLGRLAFVIAALALTALFYRVLNPETGALREFSTAQKKSAKVGIRYLWLLLAVVIPIGSVILALLGYLYSAGILLENLVQSMWLILEMVLLHQFVVRWILIARRRLALQEARAEREAMLAARENTDVPAGENTLELDEPKIDIDAVSDDVRKLLNTSLVILAVIMLWVSWSDMLPAFRIFDQVTLWQHKVSVEGIIEYMPVTLADIILAIITLIVLIILVKRLPAFIELLLRQRSEISPGSLYAIKSLTSYTLIAVGVSILFSKLGGTWSEIQWIFAALGVGIGFGLQEIVANFISGLIILFERPIRIGDVVTVGDVSGVVTKIRIRATTIRDFDRKELLVPNKEFITGRLLNWSLSDTVSRISVSVGVAYGSDVELATKLMEQSAIESKYIIDEPAPFVTFESFDDNALTLVLRYFIDNMDYRLLSKSELHEAINRKFAAAGISIAFPQRDVHLDTNQPLDIRIQREPKHS